MVTASLVPLEFHVVSGTVRDPDDIPVRGVTVSVTSRVGEATFRREATTDDEGTYAVTVPAGLVEATVFAIYAGTGSASAAVAGDTVLNITTSAPVPWVVDPTVRVQLAGEPSPEPIDLANRVTALHYRLQVWHGNSLMEPTQFPVWLPLDQRDPVEVCVNALEIGAGAGCGEGVYDDATRSVGTDLHCLG